MYLQSIHLTRLLSRLITVKPQQSEWRTTELFSAECGAPLNSSRVATANLVLYPTIIPDFIPTFSTHTRSVSFNKWKLLTASRRWTMVPPNHQSWVVQRQMCSSAMSNPGGGGERDSMDGGWWYWWGASLWSTIAEVILILFQKWSRVQMSLNENT